MMLEHFGLHSNPFGIAPKLDFLYRSVAFEESMAHLVYGLDNSEAVVMITGAIGTGKTMAIQSFLSHLGDSYVSALVTNTNVDTKELLKLVLDDLGVQIIPGADKSDLLIALKNYLIEQDTAGRRTIVVIDEAQNLSREVLEEVRLLTNIGQGDRQPVQVVLVGQPELETKIRREDLAQLRQRIRVHYVLEPLTRAELEQYVNHRIKVAGGKTGIFTPKALDRVHAISGGVPRVVNSVCGEALLTALLADNVRVEPRDVEGISENEPASPQEPPIRVAEEVVVSPEPRPGPRRASIPEEEVRNPEPMFQPRTDNVGLHEKAAKEPARGRLKMHPALVFVLIVIVFAVAAVFLFPDHIPFLADQVGEDATPQTAASPTQSMPNESAMIADPEIGSKDRVEIETLVEPDLEEKPSAEPTVSRVAIQDSIRPAPTPGSAGFYLHVSSFRDFSRAENSANRFVTQGLQALVSTHVSRGVNWYRVNLGPYGDRDEAVLEANNLEGQGRIKYYKVVRLNESE